MDLENSIIPKVEKEIPSTLELTSTMLPCIGDWEVGERYLVQLSVENVSKRQGSMYDPNDNQLRSSFLVLGARSLEGIEDQPKKEPPKSFLRALAKLFGEDDGR